MKLSMREFQLNGASYLNQLPIVLTRYGKPVAKVVSYFGGKEALEKVLKPSKKIPKLCPKHGGMLIGGQYTCGCTP